MTRLLIALLALALPANLQASSSGTPLWEYRAGAGIWSQPACADGILYFGCDDGRVLALNLESRGLIWLFETGDRVRSGVTLHDSRALFASDDGNLYSLDARTGGELWRFDLGSAELERRLPAESAPYTYDYAHSSPIVHDGVVYVGSSDRHLYAIDFFTGELRWKYETGGMVRATPAIADGLVFVGSWDGTFYALDILGGDERWQFESGGPILGGAAVDDGKVVFGSRSARIFARDAASGEPEWQYVYAEGSWVESPPVIDNGTVYIGSSDALKLSAFDLATGAERWHFNTRGWSWGMPLVTDDVVYIGAISASPYYMPGVTLRPGLHAVDRVTGESVWMMTPDPLDGYLTGGVFATPVIFDGVVYVVGIGGVIYAVRR